VILRPCLSTGLPLSVEVLKNQYSIVPIPKKKGGLKKVNKLLATQGFLPQHHFSKYLYFPFF